MQLATPKKVKGTDVVVIPKSFEALCDGNYSPTVHIPNRSKVWRVSPENVGIVGKSQ